MHVDFRILTPKAFIPFVAMLSCASAGSGSGVEADFNRDVKPILSGKCFACHGPDGAERKAGLRLDQKESAYSERDGVRAVVPGDLSASELVRRIESADPDTHMPPEESHKEINSEEVSILKAWIAQGAVYEDHWAFVPPKQSSGDSIDSYVEARLTKSGLEFSPESHRETLIRRVTFDLTGLPPTPEDVAAFVNDQSPNAYDKLVDRLLRSEHYGERMALAWMDAARYGDTSVMHADGHRDMWLWRDWIIKAYNDNMPFDQFTIEQIAGDLLPDSTTDQKVASGFNRNHATSDEGGAIDEELRIEYVVDRVRTTANVWLALSMECGQCHDHKYDPISQREYYQMFAYFNNTSDPGMQTRNGNQAPLVKVFSPERQKKREELQAELTKLKEERETSKPTWEEVSAWASGLGGDGLPTLGEWRMLGAFKANDPKHGFNHNFGPEKELKLDKEHDGKKWEIAPKAWLADGTVHEIENPDSHVLYLHRTISVERAQVVPVSLGSDDAVKAWLDGKQVIANNVARAAAPNQERANLELKKGANQFLIKLVNHSGPSGFAFSLGATGLPEDIRKLVEAKSIPEEERGVVSEYFAQHIWAKGQELDKQISDVTGEEKTLVDKAPTSMVMGDKATEPRMTYILNRGQYDQPIKDEVIPPGTPSFLPALPEGAPANRLALARWLVDAKNPLPGRVAVNRYWTMLFGQGLVKTAGDFGNQGAPPTHPKLLDWLAVDFVKSGWDIKRMIKQIVVSATYRQTSRLTPNLRNDDPLNLLLARGPRFRLQGEFIRDNALAVSGLLVNKVGGPSVKPYQPDGIWNEVSLNGGLRYKRDSGEGLYRRSLYTYWKRSAPMPNMLIFDAPTREKCTIVRERTNTPLQAFVTLNDPQFVEAARVLAESLIKRGGSFEARLTAAYRQILSRPPRADEIGVLKQIFDSQHAVFEKFPEKSDEYLKVGEAKRDESLDKGEHAAWTVITQMLFNLDETVTRG
jgi:hypothetical protein